MESNIRLAGALPTHKFHSIHKMQDSNDKTLIINACVFCLVCSAWKYNIFLDFAFFLRYSLRSYILGPNL